jgi:hypothetical protein
VLLGARRGGPRLQRGRRPRRLLSLPAAPRNPESERERERERESACSSDRARAGKTSSQGGFIGAFYRIATRIMLLSLEQVRLKAQART